MNEKGTGRAPNPLKKASIGSIIEPSKHQAHSPKFLELWVLCPGQVDGFVFVHHKQSRCRQFGSLPCLQHKPTLSIAQIFRQLLEGAHPGIPDHCLAFFLVLPGQFPEGAKIMGLPQLKAAFQSLFQ